MERIRRQKEENEPRLGAETLAVETPKADFCFEHDVTELLKWIEYQKFLLEDLGPGKFQVGLGQQRTMHLPNVTTMCSKISGQPKDLLNNWKLLKSSLIISVTQLGPKIQLDVQEFHVLGPLSSKYQAEFTGISCNFIKSILTSWKEQLTLVLQFVRALSTFLKTRNLTTFRNFPISKLGEIGDGNSSASENDGIAIIGVEKLNIFLVCHLMPSIEERALVVIVLHWADSFTMKFNCTNQIHIHQMIESLGSKITESVHSQINSEPTIELVKKRSSDSSSSSERKSDFIPPKKSREEKKEKKRPFECASLPYRQHISDLSLLKKARVSKSSAKTAKLTALNEELASIAMEHDTKFIVGQTECQFRSRFSNFFIKLNGPFLPPNESNDIFTRLIVQRDSKSSFEVVEIIEIPYVHTYKRGIDRVKDVNLKSTVSQIFLQSWRSQLALLEYFVEKLSSLMEKNDLKSNVEYERETGLLMMSLSRRRRRSVLKLNCTIFPSPNHRPLLSVKLPGVIFACRDEARINVLMWRISNFLA